MTTTGTTMPDGPPGVNARTPYLYRSGKTRVDHLHRHGPLTYRVLGDLTPNTSGSPAYVLVHGIGMSHRYLSRLHLRLARTNPTFSIDMPGYAGLPKPGIDADVETMARGLVGAIESLDVGPVVLVGHSMGAQWATVAALTNPELVERLVLMGPVADSQHRTLCAQTAALVRDGFGESAGTNAIIVTDYLRCGMPWYLAQSRHLLTYAIEDHVARLTMPTLILRGELDPIAGRDWCHRLAELAPASAVVEIPGQHHVVQHSAPAAVADAIRAFAPVTKSPKRANSVKDLARFGAWWARDYAYAVAWQARALVGKVAPDSFLTGTGTPIVVLPGIWEPWRFMQPLITRLHAQGHPVHVVPDLRRNHRPVTEMAEHVEAYLTAAGLEDVILVAHSKGGLAGKLAMMGPAGWRIRGMLAIATPFGGSRYAGLMPMRSLRAFSARDPSMVRLALETAVNARIVSVYSRFDPHIPGGSELPGAKNVSLDTGGHFSILAHPEVLAELATFLD